MSISQRDPNVISRYEHDEVLNAKRVKIVGGEIVIPEVKFPDNMKFSTIEVPKIIEQIKIERIEVPVIVKEMVELRIPEIVYKTEVKEIDKIITLTEVKTIEIPTIVEKPVYIDKPIIIEKIITDKWNLTNVLSVISQVLTALLIVAILIKK